MKYGVENALNSSLRVNSPYYKISLMLALMERHQISALVVVDDQNTILGVVTLLALLKAGIS